MIEVGQALPQATFSLIQDGDMKNPHTDDLFSGKKVVLFSVPGAFTPTCSQAHLPGYVALADKMKEKGVDSIICLSVNDAFVMKAWGDSSNADEITMLADGNASFAKAIGLDMDTDTFGGVRSQRFSMLVEDGVVKALNVEAPGRFEVSDAETMLKALQSAPVHIRCMKARTVWRTFKWSGTLCCTGVVVLYLLSPFILFANFDRQTPIAKLWFTQGVKDETSLHPITSTEVLDIWFMDLASCESTNLQIESDQIRIDAAVITWQPWLTAIGVESIYSLERLSERFSDIEAQTMRQLKAKDLRSDVVIDPFNFDIKDGQGNFAVNSRFGSSVYVDADVTKEYVVYLTEDALTVKASAKPSTLQQDGDLVIAIDHPCRPAPPLSPVLQWLNKNWPL